MYEVMRYRDDDHPEWDAEEHAFAASVAEPAEMGRLALVARGLTLSGLSLGLQWGAAPRVPQGRAKTARRTSYLITTTGSIPS
jgi:hypothetical protein